MIIEYLKIDNFKIGADVDEQGAIKGFYVCDRNLQIFNSHKFDFASHAIDWAHKNFKELL